MDEHLAGGADLIVLLRQIQRRKPSDEAGIMQMLNGLTRANSLDAKNHI